MLKANSLWHCFTFDNSIHASDLSIISLSSRPESVGRNIQTVILPGCESESDAKVVEIRLYCQPPVKDLNRGETKERHICVRFLYYCICLTFTVFRY